MVISSHTASHGVNLGHNLHLLRPLLEVVLIDADGVDPNDAGNEEVPELEQRSVQIRPHFNGAPVDEHGVEDVRYAPNI